MNHEQYPDEINPLLTLGLIFITFGIYIIFWIYIANKQQKKFNSNFPDSNRGLSVMFIVPIIFGTILWISYMLLNQIIFIILTYIFSTIILFMLIKYLFEFSYESSKFTNSNIFVWFIPFCITIAGTILTILNIKYGFFMLLTTFIHIPYLQTCLNVKYKNIKVKEEKKKMYR